MLSLLFADILKLLPLTAWVLFLAASVVNAVYLFALWWAWRERSRKPAPSQAVFPSFSVVIAARNEAENLSRFLPKLLALDYPDYEVVIVLDRCTDESLQIVESWQKQHPQLRCVAVTEIPEGWAAKKYVMTQGVAAAQHDWLALTDADCEVQTNWLSEIAAQIDVETELVLGISPYFEEKSLLNMLIQYETFYAAFQYIGFAVLGMPYMGVGRNLAYKKSLFERAKGFERFKERLSGDDDLFVNAFAHPARTAVMVSPASMTYSVPKQQWRAWLRQKLRHSSASTAYSLPTQLLLTAFGFSYIGHYFWGMVAIGSGIPPMNVFFVYLTRIALLYLIFRVPLTIPLKNKAFLPLLDFLNVLYSTLIVPLGTLLTPKWH